MDFRLAGRRRPIFPILDEATPFSCTSSLHFTWPEDRRLSPARSSLLTTELAWGQPPISDPSIMRHEAANGRSVQCQGLMGISFASSQGPPASLGSCSIYCRHSHFSSVIFTPNVQWETQSLQEKPLQVVLMRVGGGELRLGRACAGLIMKCVSLGIQRGEGLSPGQLLQPLSVQDESCLVFAPERPGFCSMSLFSACLLTTGMDAAGSVHPLQIHAHKGSAGCRL